MRVRPTLHSDIPALQIVLEQTELFPGEMLPDMLAGFFSGDALAHWLTCGSDGNIVGFCYAAPEQLTDGTWNMLAIAVHPSHQGTGCGAALVDHLETTLRNEGNRLLIADTSGKDAFAATRAFYRKRGFDEEARIRDFWASGDDKVTFRKSLV